MVSQAGRTVALATAAAAAAVIVMSGERTVVVEVGAGLVLAAALMLLAHTALRMAEDPGSARRDRGPGARRR